MDMWLCKIVEIFGLSFNSFALYTFIHEIKKKKEKKILDCIFLRYFGQTCHLKTRYNVTIYR